MKIFIVLCLVAVSLAKESHLKAILRSPGETLKLYQDFKTKEHLNFDNAEDRLRFRVFRKSAEMVADENSVEGETAVFALNMFSTMTPAEKQSYLGLNVTGHLPNAKPALKSSGVAAPDSKQWVNDKLVTSVKNQ